MTTLFNTKRGETKMKRSRRKVVVKADFDAEKFRQRHAAARQKRADRAGNTTKMINQIKEAEEPIQEAFELLVPSSGKADTVAGEIVRAMMRIMYRDWNDGDLFYDGYGIETCGDAVAYLCDKLYRTTYSSFEDIAMRGLKEDAYSDALADIANDVMDYLYDHPELFTQPNSDDSRDYDGEQFIRDNEWEQTFDDVYYLPDNVKYHIEAGHIDNRDIVWQLESWDGFDGVEVNLDYYNNIELSNMTSEQYDEISHNIDRWLEDWGYDLDDEYGSEEDEEEEEEEEEY